MPIDSIAYRAEVGPLLSRNEFLLNRLGRNIMELQKAFQIRYERGLPEAHDSALADRLWQAGVELLSRTGIYCVSSRRLIEVSKDEIEKALALVPTEVTLGSGPDAVTVAARKPGAVGKPVVFSGPFNSTVDDLSFLRINEACAREKAVDVLHMPGCISVYRGLRPRPDSGLAMDMADFYGRMTGEAVTRAGRPGMPVVGYVYTGLGDIAASNQPAGLGPGHMRAVVMLPELVVDDLLLARLTYYQERSVPVILAFTPFIGGHGGDPAGTALVAIATLQAAALLGCPVAHFGAQHSVYLSQTNAQSLWVTGLVTKAACRNSRGPFVVSHTTTAGPGTPQYVHEFAALLLTSVPAGGHVAGPRPSQPQRLNQVSPLLCRLFAEVARAAARLDCSKANALALELHDRYEGNLNPRHAPAGLTFEEMYDLETLSPRPEHVAHYLEARGELLRLGLPLELDQ